MFHIQEPPFGTYTVFEGDIDHDTVPLEERIIGVKRVGTEGIICLCGFVGSEDAREDAEEIAAALNAHRKPSPKGSKNTYFRALTTAERLPQKGDLLQADSETREYISRVDGGPITVEVTR